MTAERRILELVAAVMHAANVDRVEVPMERIAGFGMGGMYIRAYHDLARDVVTFTLHEFPPGTPHPQDLVAIGSHPAADGGIVSEEITS